MGVDDSAVAAGAVVAACDVAVMSMLSILPLLASAAFVANIFLVAASNFAASILASVTLAAPLAALFIISSAVGGGDAADFTVSFDVVVSLATFDFSNTMSFIFESSMVVVMESIPLDVSISYFLVCAAADPLDDFPSFVGVSSDFSFTDFGSVAVFVVVLVFVVCGDAAAAAADVCVVAGGDAMT